MNITYNKINGNSVVIPPQLKHFCHFLEEYYLDFVPCHQECIAVKVDKSIIFVHFDLYLPSIDTYLIFEVNEFELSQSYKKYILKNIQSEGVFIGDIKFIMDCISKAKIPNKGK